MSKTKVLISFALIFVLILLPTAAFAKSFGYPNTDLDSTIYSGTNLTINKSKVSVNQTVRVKLTLKYDGTKAPGKAKLNIVKTDKTDGSTSNIDDLSGVTVTSPSGKIVWKFKISDYDYTAETGDKFTLTVSVTDEYNINIFNGSTIVEVR